MLFLNKEGSSTESHSEAQRRPVRMSHARRVCFFFPAGLPAASPPARLFHAVFKETEEDADFPVKSHPLPEERLSIKQSCGLLVGENGRGGAAERRNSAPPVQCGAGVGG